MGLFDFLKKADPNLSLPQNDKEIWYRDTYAIWSQTNFFDFTHFCGCEFTNENKKQNHRMLINDWGLNNGQECIEMVDRMVLDIKELDGKMTKPDKAWDLCRATQILGMAYLAGMIDRDTMNKKSGKVGRLMQEIFDSWQELTGSYMVGYQLWAKETFGDEAQDYIDDRLQAYSEIINHQNPPYTIDWNLELD